MSRANPSQTYSAKASRAWREANPGKARASATPYKGAKYYREWRKSKTPEQLSQWGRNWRTRHPEAVLHKNALYRARANKIEFSILLADVVLTEQCPCCGWIMEIGTGTLHKRSPTLDRIDITQGYVPGNVWVICHNCNRQKSDMTVARLRQLADIIERNMPCDF